MLDLTSAYDLTFMFPSGDQTVGRTLRDHGEFSRVEFDFFLDHAGEASGTLIDVGANIGSVSLPFAKAKPQWSVVAIEAHRSLAGVLCANALINRLFNVEVLNIAAGAQRSIAEFPAARLDERRNFGALGFNSDGAREPVLMRTLDELAPIDTRLVKIDVEGYEPEVLKGAAELIARQEIIWLFEATIQHREAAASTIRTMRDAGYQLFWFFVPFATPTAEKGAPPTPFTGDANVVALPPGVGNRWNLTPIGEPGEIRPGVASAYPYLARYGYA